MMTQGHHALWLASQPLILASTSATRLKLLQDISIPVEPMAAQVDERLIEQALQAQKTHPAQIALALADAKARDVADRFPNRWIVAADQTLALGDEQFHKAASIERAGEQLKKMRGRTHQLHSAFVCYHGTERQYGHVETAQLTMRTFSDAFLAVYLEAAGSRVMQSVGAYQLEGLGIHLFEKIEGDHSTILGLPLLPLLAFLRQAGLVEA